ncbi:MAG: short-chain dehydrogenase [Crenarchaeota archaeon 13_1_20CM_2_51_8]|nr:MAG: short-chain dehydrogenase [Crenarchaeota archaeon 13_1_20CM_2_51_8]
MTNEVTVITGASSGIGAALAKQLGSKGHQLVLAARREKELKEVAKQAGTRVLVVPTDVTRRGDVERLRSQALKEYGHVDVWVNNAGRGITKSVMDLTDQDFDEITAVVLKSVLYGMQTIIPHFQERGQGHLINVSSFLGRVPLVSHRSIYSAAKSGVNVLTANIRMDLKEKYPGIHISLVMPGIVDTDFHKVARTPQLPKAGTRVGSLIVESAEQVASQISSLIELPVAELYTNPAMVGLVSQYYQDVRKFEENKAQRTGSG